MPADSSFEYRVSSRDRREMKATEAVLVVSFAFNFVVRSVASGNVFPADYLEENPLSVDSEWLSSVRERDGASGESRRNANDDELENWKGRWLPARPSDPAPPPKVLPRNDHRPANFESPQTLHGVAMGQPSPNCDDAKTNLTVDWDGSPIVHTCYDRRIAPDRNAAAIQYCERIPKYYVATHKCMQEAIEYDDDVPLFGPHRPLWPVYGEYKYLPKQRWLHSLEHGAIVALYHPCANPMEVRRFKSLVSGCLRRRVISPYNLLDEHRPLVLVAWGCRLSMSRFDPELAIRFIRQHALRGPENISRDGDFADGLLEGAKIVSNLDDTVLCPNAFANERAI